MQEGIFKAVMTAITVLLACHSPYLRHRQHTGKHNVTLREMLSREMAKSPPCAYQIESCVADQTPFLRVSAAGAAAQPRPGDNPAGVHRPPGTRFVRHFGHRRQAACPVHPGIQHVPEACDDDGRMLYHQCILPDKFQCLLLGFSGHCARQFFPCTASGDVHGHAAL